MEGFLLRFREESINEGVGWKVCVEGGGCVRDCVSVFERRSEWVGKWVTVCVRKVECVRVRGVRGGCVFMGVCRVLVCVHALHMLYCRRLCLVHMEMWFHVFI